MKKQSAFLMALCAAALFLAAASCAPGNRLIMKSAETSDVSGSYRLILYGCNHYNDLETLAILDKTDDPYTFEPLAPDFDYRVRKDVPAKTALGEAEKFVDCHNAFRGAQLSRLVDAEGETLGYEVRPLYMAFVFGETDVLRTDYRIKKDKVIVKIWLSGVIERMLEDGGSREREP